jgi:uncharacterized protein YjbI with pentapeptide repeats
MKVFKPQRLGVLHRVVEHRRRYTFVVSVLVYVPLEEPRKLLTEMTMWREIGLELPNGVADEGFPKPYGELLLTAFAYPSPASDAHAVVRAQVGPIDKRLAVFGDRFWEGDEISQPKRFERIPIDWAHAFGGEALAENPVGKGVTVTKTDKGDVLLLPNIEDPERLIVSKGDRPPPAGFAGYDVMWPQRYRKLGSYDGRWLETLFPGPAEDFDATFYNSAPPDQRLDEFFAGDESIVLEGMHPEKARIEAKLEKLVVRAFAWQTSDGAEPVCRPIGTRLDTVHLFPHRERALLIFRGTLPVGEDDADDIEHLMIAAEDPTAPRDVEHYERVRALRLDRKRGALYGMKDQDLLPPESVGWTVRIDPGDVGEMTRREHIALHQALRGRERAIAKRREELAKDGHDPDVYLPAANPHVDTGPDPYDIDAVIAFTEKAMADLEWTEKESAGKRAAVDREARERFAAAGFDWDKEKQSVAKKNAGPPKYSADEHLGALHDLARIANENGKPNAALESDLSNPEFEAMLREMETRRREGYRMTVQEQHPATADEDARQMLRALVQLAIEHRESLAQRDLTCADLHGLDLSEMDLKGAFLEGADLRGVVLYRAQLSNAVLARADLTGADLTGADLSGATLAAATLRDTNLSDTVLIRTKLTRAVLDGVAFANARMRSTDFLEAEFRAADFSSIDAEQLIFMRADLRKAAFVGARLTRSMFIECNVEGVDFTGCDLGKVQFISTKGDGATFLSARLYNAVFVHDSSFARCEFASSELLSSNFRMTPLCEASFAGAKLDGSDFSKCDLRSAKMHRIVARGALFIRSDLRGADLRGADLLGAIMQKANLRGTDLRGANISRGDVSLARLDQGTKIDDALLIDTRVHPLFDASLNPSRMAAPPVEPQEPHG